MKFSCLATRDPPQKKRKRWIDGVVEYEEGGFLKLYNRVVLDEGRVSAALLGTLLIKNPKLESGEEFEFESGWVCEVESRMDIFSSCPPKAVLVSTPPNEMMPAKSSFKQLPRTDQEILALFSL